jgi:outer membrane protein assembly factor BamA
VLERRGWLDASAAYSWRGYKVVDAAFEVPEIGGSRITLGTQLHWQDLTQVQYFGAGDDSTPVLRSDYGLSTAEIMGFANYRALDGLSFEARVGRVSRPDLSSSSGPFDRGYPDAMLIFRNEPGFDQLEQPGFLHTHLSATADTRDHPGHPLAGAVYRAVAAIYSDRDDGQFSFRRYELETLQVVPLSPVRWTLAFHGWGAFSDTSGTSEVPSYMLPSLGGSTTLRSFSDYRFHDRHMLLASVESRWALFEHVDAAFFVDAGGVASRVGDLGLKETSIGAGVRVHIRSTTIGRVDVAHGREGWRLLLRLNDPFRLNRLARRNASIPFVP